jgi:predicted DCC family thiol-disulfide oxidoreductase YuxK
MCPVRDREPFSYLHDSALPAFRVRGVFTVMDAHCSLCARGATWIARNDSAEEFTIIPLQSPVGSALMRHYGLDPADPLSWLYLEDGRAYSSLDALVRVGWRLGGIWKGLVILQVLPRWLQDALYRVVARNRYRLFGTAELCSLPDPEVQKRLML